MIDIAAEKGWLASTLRIMQLLQMIIQARWIDEPAVITLPHINKEHLPLFSSLPAPLPVLCAATINNYSRLTKALSKEFHEEQIHQVNLYYTFRFLYFFLFLVLFKGIYSISNFSYIRYIKLSNKCQCCVSI